MSKQALIDPKDYPLDQVWMGPEDFGKYNPQRHEFAQITNVLHYDADANLLVASRVLGEEEWWCRGHIPGRPLFPGVMQAEVMAQASSVHCHLYGNHGDEVFLGFAGIEDTRFRQTIEPGEKLWVAGTVERANVRRAAYRWRGQIIKEDGTVASSGLIIGMSF